MTISISLLEFILLNRYNINYCCFLSTSVGEGELGTSAAGDTFWEHLSYFLKNIFDKIKVNLDQRSLVNNIAECGINWRFSRTLWMSQGTETLLLWPTNSRGPSYLLCNIWAPSTKPFSSTASSSWGKPNSFFTASSWPAQEIWSKFTLCQVWRTLK